MNIQLKKDVDNTLKKIHASDVEARLTVRKLNMLNSVMSVVSYTVLFLLFFKVINLNLLTTAMVAILLGLIASYFLDKILADKTRIEPIGIIGSAYRWLTDKELAELISPVKEILKNRTIITHAEKDALEKLLDRIGFFTAHTTHQAMPTKTQEKHENPNVLCVNYLSKHGTLMYTATSSVSRNVLASIVIYVKTPQDSNDTCSASFTINFINPYNLGDFNSAHEFESLLSVNDFNVLKAFPRLLDCLSNSGSRSISVDELCSRLDAIGATKGAGHDGILCMWRNLSGVSEQELEDVFANTRLNFNFDTTKDSAPGKGEF